MDARAASGTATRTPAKAEPRRQTFSKVPTLDQLLSSRPEIQSPRKPKERLLFTPSRKVLASNSLRAPNCDNINEDASSSVGKYMNVTSAQKSTRRERRTTTYWRSVGMFVEDSEVEEVFGPPGDSESGDDDCDIGLRMRPIDLRQPVPKGAPSTALYVAPVITGTIHEPPERAAFDIPPMRSASSTNSHEDSSDTSLPSPEALLRDIFSPSLHNTSVRPAPGRGALPTVRLSNDIEIIELLSSDDESLESPLTLEAPVVSPRVQRAVSPVETIHDNEGMLFFEPSRRPTKTQQPTQYTTSVPSRSPSIPQIPISTTYQLGETFTLDELDDNDILFLSDSDMDIPMSPKKPRIAPRTPKTPKTPSRTAANTPRPTPGRGKKALQAQLEKLAEDTVSLLNTRVFGGRIPDSIELIWSKRLNTTAGRANWKRIRKECGDDIHQCSIELSTKVLDNDERVLNTVAHELCHLAAWVIDGEIQPAHGRSFKTWGRKVMRCCPDIEVTTRHDYEIAYKYEWRCANPACARTYGRHSKSINPAQHACGLCKGKLEPMFQTYSPSKRTAFQEYLKQNMKDLKAKEPGMSHGELMKELSRGFKEDKAKKTIEHRDTDDLIARMGQISLDNDITAGSPGLRMPGGL